MKVKQVLPLNGLSALELVRQALSHYADVAPELIVPEVRLDAIGVDSLTLAELLFELEDQIGLTIPEGRTAPHLVSDIVRLIEPYLEQAQAAA